MNKKLNRPTSSFAFASGIAVAFLTLTAISLAAQSGQILKGNVQQNATNAKIASAPNILGSMFIRLRITHKGCIAGTAASRQLNKECDLISFLMRGRN